MLPWDQILDSWPSPNDQTQNIAQKNKKGIDIEKVTLGQAFRFVMDKIKDMMGATAKPRSSYLTPPPHTVDYRMFLPGTDVNGEPDYVFRYPTETKDRVIDDPNPGQVHTIGTGIAK